MAEVWETTNFDCLKFVNVSDQETKNEIKSKWIEIREADQRQIEWLFSRNIFPKKNELKDLVNVICDRDLLVGNTSKCNQEKIEGGNGMTAAVNLTTETNRTLTDRNACLHKNSNLRSSLNFPKVSYATILKQPIWTVRPMSASVYPPLLT